MHEWFPQSLNEMIECGRTLADLLPPGIIALHGPMGAGKTTLAKGFIAQKAHVDINSITSPTFQYAAVYGDIAHCDLWRLSDTNTFFAMGLDEFLQYPTCIIEWPEKIAPYLDKAVHIFIAYHGSGRHVHISKDEVCQHSLVSNTSVLT